MAARAQVRAPGARRAGGRHGGGADSRAAADEQHLRGQGLVVVIGRSRRYKVPPEKLRAMAAFFVLREKVLRPLLANAGQRPTHPPSRTPSPVESHYFAIQGQMEKLFECIGIAA